jgi:hypothetical protein
MFLNWELKQFYMLSTSTPVWYKILNEVLRFCNALFSIPNKGEAQGVV